MAEVVRKLKINRRYASSACAWCGDALALGDGGAVCEACETPHHARCWEEGRGCGQGGCVNAPLLDIGAESGGKRQLKPDEDCCPYCGKTIRLDVDICRYCNEIVSADGLYHGEKKVAREAKLALTYAILGLFLSGLILGPLAFLKGRDAKQHIAVNPRLRGLAIATAAQWLGAADVVLALLVLPRWVRWLSK